MPLHFVPKHSSVHRIAAIALYRALLTQCAATAHVFPLARRIEMANIVRNRFRAAQHNGSPRHLQVYFAAGYEALDHLDTLVAGGGSNPLVGAEELQRRRCTVEDLLNSTPPWMKYPEKRQVRKAREKEAKKLADRAQWARELQEYGLELTADAVARITIMENTRREDRRLRERWRKKATRIEARRARRNKRPAVDVVPAEPVRSKADEDALHVLQRVRLAMDQRSYSSRPLPRAALTGRRRVPEFFAANLLPALRFGRPQPAAFSLFIRRLTQVRMSRIDHRRRLRAERALAEFEDHWDRLVSADGDDHVAEDRDDLVAEDRKDLVADGRDRLVADDRDDLVADDRDDLATDDRDDLVADDRDDLATDDRDDLVADYRDNPVSDDTASGEPRWVAAVDRGVEVVGIRLITAARRRHQVSREMMDIVDKERALLVEEKKADRAARRKRRARDLRREQRTQAQAPEQSQGQQDTVLSGEPRPRNEG